METQILIEIFERDLSALEKEIQSYESETKLWIIENQISNSAGNLCLHVLGNLNHFIGCVLGKTGYVRNRELEFSSKNVPAKDLIHAIEQCMIMIKTALSSLSASDLNAEFPLEIMGKRASTQFWLIHFACHLNYHLGQINYHRRLISA